jgi:hypothetical protein
VELPHLRDDHEAFAGHIELVCGFHVASQNQHQSIAWTELVIRVDRTEQIRVEAQSRRPKHLEAENVEAAVQADERIGDVGADHGASSQAVERVVLKKRFPAPDEGIARRRAQRVRLYGAKKGDVGAVRDPQLLHRVE